MSGPPPGRAWSTWDARYPACVVHLPSRFAVRVALFSATENRYDDFPAEHQHAFALGEHAADGSYVALRVSSAGTTLAVEFACDDRSGISGRVRVVEPGEMLFRLGIMVEAGYLDPPSGGRELALLGDGAVPARMASEVRARHGGEVMHLAVAPTPAISGQYARLADVASDLERRGWLYHPPPCPGGDWVAMRILGNPREPITFAVGHGSDEADADAAARARLRDADATIDAAAAETTGAGPPAARAIRDVMAWNTVWDASNERPFTALSRGWMRGFGGWGIWMSDAFYNALLCARAGDAAMARANVEAVLAAQQPAGNIPCLVAADERWIDRTQLPVAAFMTWRSYLYTGDRGLLELAYPALERHLAWIARERDGNDNGLYEYGSSPVGDAQGTFTKQGALNESGMDNLAVFDEATFVESAHTIDLEEPGHNSLIALELEALSWIASELGRPGAEAAAHRAAADALRARIAERLWDPAREVFAARLWDGRFVAHLSPTSFFPLVAGAASEERIEAMLARHLLDPGAFWGELPLPSAPLDDHVNAEDSYWRGRIWPPHVYWVWEGLRRAGRESVAAELAARAWAMFEPEWTGKRHSHENFSSHDPAAHEAHDSDPFYSWGALIPFIAEAQRSDVNPWTDAGPRTGR